ncbi:MAG: hypothetical protein JWM11_215 [Planctomycetaceae bacterium]|nr:hypothetical protein [Planctomycetaceae bacterium]
MCVLQQVRGRYQSPAFAALVFVICASMQIAHSDEVKPSDQPLKKRLAGLMRELDADQRARRIHAERELLDLGPAILDELPPPELIANPAVRTSVSKIRKVLELRKATESIRPSTITTAAGITFEEFVKNMAVQTSNQIDMRLLTPKELQWTVPQAFQGETFWNAVDATLSKSMIRANFHPEAAALVLLPREKQAPNNQLAVHRVGPYRVVLESLKLRPIAGSTQQRLRADLSVTPEPRLRALFLKFQAKDFFVTTMKGKIFPPADPDAQLDLPLGEGGHYVRWTLDFLAPPDLAASELENLHITGKATMQVAAESEHIRIKDLAVAEGVARRRGGVTVSVMKVQARELPNEKRDISVRIQVAYDAGGPAFESHRTWIFHNQVYLEPLEGEPIRANGGYETNLQANGVVGVTYRFTGVRTPLNQLQFVYVAPTLIIDSPLSFELVSEKAANGPGKSTAVPAG